MISAFKWCNFSSTESERIVRLPLFYGLTENDIELVCAGIKQFYKH